MSLTTLTLGLPSEENYKDDIDSGDADGHDDANGSLNKGFLERCNGSRFHQSQQSPKKKYIKHIIMRLDVSRQLLLH